MAQDRVRTVVVVNTILCVLALLPAVGGFFFAAMGGSTASVGAPVLGSTVALMGVALPVMPVASIVGSWIGYVKRSTKTAMTFVVLPWAYALVLTALIMVLFSVANA